MQEKPRSESLQQMEEKKVVQGLIGFWSETTSNTQTKKDSDSKLQETQSKPSSSMSGQQHPNANLKR
jgi:hypothetical protein